MKLSLSSLKSSKGFTLIELLVVIAIIGILAAALIATIDPLEQIKKGQDSTLKTTAVQYLSAIQRYFGTNQQYPWAVAATACTAITVNSNILLSNANLTNTTNGCTQMLINSGELKSSFSGLNTATLDAISLIVTGTGVTDQAAQAAVCYRPQSKAGMQDQNTRYGPLGQSPYDPPGGPVLNCPTGAANECYWCAK